MSLISTKNLISPLTNKVHMVFIILCATAFAALRLSGGTLSVGNDEASSRRSSPVTKTETTRSSRSNYQSSRKANDESKSKPTTHSSTKKNTATASKPPAKEKTGGSLDDIEATLGLR